MLFLDVQFLNRVSHKLRNFAKKNDYTWNFSCPFCGDSSKNARRARGYVYKKSTNLFYRCHNCNHGTTLSGLVQHLDENIYNEYRLENFKLQDKPVTAQASKTDDDQYFSFFETESKVGWKDSKLDGLKTIESLPNTHYAKKYLLDRKIKSRLFGEIFYTPDFFGYVESIDPTKPKVAGQPDQPRIVIPYLTEHGKMFGLAGRSLRGENPKYFFSLLDKSKDLIFGLQKLDCTKKIYAVEGQFDSMFLPNAIAVGGSNFINMTTKALQSKLVCVVDNEPRNKYIIQSMEKIVNSGFAICIWPESVTQKDINEMIIAGYTATEIQEIIDASTYKGLEAMLRLQAWKKQLSTPQRTIKLKDEIYEV